MDEFQSVQASPKVEFNQDPFFQTLLGRLVILGLIILFVVLVKFIFNNSSLPFLSKNPQPTSTPSPTPIPLSKITVSCPMSKDYCATGRVIATDSGKIKLYAIAYNLPTNTKLLAVFPGTFDLSLAAGNTMKAHDVINLHFEDQKDVVAIYDFYGQAINPFYDNMSAGLRSFKTNDPIATIGKSNPKKGEGGTNFPDIEPLNKANLLFSVKRGNNYLKINLNADKTGFVIAE